MESSGGGVEVCGEDELRKLLEKLPAATRAEVLREPEEEEKAIRTPQGEGEGGGGCSVGIPARPLWRALLRSPPPPPPPPPPPWAALLLPPPSPLGDNKNHDEDDVIVSHVAFLLGMRRTVGSLPSSLPPSLSVLLRSFRQPHVRRGRSVLLTVGGRALTKHCQRCTQGWWGDARGSAQEINDKAERKVLHLLLNCVWMNAHLLPHNLPVFEVRVEEGYGARWSVDGTEFRGFLEPPSEDGHDKGWIH